MESSSARAAPTKSRTEVKILVVISSLRTLGSAVATDSARTETLLYDGFVVPKEERSGMSLQERESAREIETMQFKASGAAAAVFKKLSDARRRRNATRERPRAFRRTCEQRAPRA